MRRVNSVGRALVCDIGQADITTLLLASDETFPGVGALLDDLFCVLLVFAFAAERELVLGLAIWDLVDTEPLVGCSEEAGKVTLNILNVIQFGCERIIDLKRFCQFWHEMNVLLATHIDDNNLPIRLLFIKERHDAEDLDLLDLAGVADKLADFANIQWIIVALGFGLGVDDVGVFPGLRMSEVKGGFACSGCSPWGMHRSSRGSPCGESSCERSGVCPS